MKTIFFATAACLASSLAYAAPGGPVGPVKPVVIVNDTVTVDGSVEAILDEPVEVEGVLGVDVLSLPESSTNFDSFVSAGLVGSVWGSNPVREGNTAFEGILESLQVQFQVNGILLRDSGDPAFFATDVSCSLIIEAVKDGTAKLLYQAWITQSNDRGGSGVVSVPALDLRGGGQIRTRLEGPVDNPADDIPGGSPVCFVRWTALGSS